MVAKKPKAQVADPMKDFAEEKEDPGFQSNTATASGVGLESIHVTRSQLEEVLRENMLRKTGSLPIEGQFEDLWRRLRDE